GQRRDRNFDSPKLGSTAIGLAAGDDVDSMLSIAEIEEHDRATDLAARSIPDHNLEIADFDVIPGEIDRILSGRARRRGRLAGVMVAQRGLAIDRHQPAALRLT